jgi:glycosyltransferase involved in cell wall biosynthesis
MNVVIFTRKLSGVMGGMERQLLNIATGLVRRNHEVTVVSLDNASVNPFFDHDARIRFVSLNQGDSEVKASWQNRITRQLKVYKILGSTQTELAICFMTGSFWYSLLPAKLRRVPIILAERNGPSIYTRTRVRKYRHLIYITMFFATRITVQFENYKSAYPCYLRKKIIVIPNQIPTFSPPPRASSPYIRFVFAGRLSSQKQIIELVQAFSLFVQVRKDCRLSIYGDGELRSEIVTLIKSRELGGFVSLSPSTKNIEEALSEADAMLAPSLWEGFPNSVAEALAHGVPVGGFSDCEGVRDLVQNGSNGWLIERTDSILSQLELLKLIASQRIYFSLFSKKAELSMVAFQGEIPHNSWNHLVLSLRR